MADKSNAMHAGARAVAARVQGARAAVPGDRGARTSTSTRWRCCWCRIPSQFDVIVTNNLFGDIITDLGAALQGGLGMAASGEHAPGPDVDVRAGPRLGAAARREERREPDRRDPVGRADARDARAARGGCGRSSGRSKRRSRRCRRRAISADRSARARPGDRRRRSGRS